MGCDGPLAEDHLAGVYVIVNGMEAVTAGKAGALHNDLSHLLAAAAGKVLADLHVVKVSVQVYAVQVAQVFGHIRFLSVPSQLLQGLLDLAPASLLLVALDDLISLS